MKIRAASQLDRPAIAAVQTASWRATYRGMLPDEYLDHEVAGDLSCHWATVGFLPDDVVLVADDGQVVGFIAIWCRPDPYIDNLHVMPDRQSEGVGRKLMVAGAEELRRRGHGTAYLWVMENNLRAIRFYEGLGGVRTKLEDKDVFGHMVPNFRIEWRDLSVIAERASA